MEVDEGDRPQSVDAWRQALAGGSRRKGPTKPVRKSTTQTPQGTTTERTGTSWSTVALTAVIVALLGVGAWWGLQEYPELFGQGAGDTPVVAALETLKDMSGETQQEAETRETGEAVAGAEQTCRLRPRNRRCLRKRLKWRGYWHPPRRTSKRGV